MSTRSLTMCTRTQFTWQVKVSARQVIIFCNMYQNASHLTSQSFGKTPGIQFLQCVSERITLGKSRFWPDLKHSFITMCTRTHYTWKVKILAQRQTLIYYNVYQNATTFGKSRFEKTYGIHLLQCVPERITLGKSRFWPDLRHSILTMRIRMHYTWQVKVLARFQAFISCKVYQNALHLASQDFG